MTINSTPPSYSSVNDPLIWAVYDANSIDVTKLNYKYVADLYINSVFVFRAKSFQNPVNNRGIFDLSAVVREYLISAFKSEQGVGEFSQSIVVKFGEEYNFVLYADLVTSTITVFNHYNARTSNFTDLATYADLPASNRPLKIVIPSGTATYYLPYFATTTTPFTVVINGTTTTITPSATNTMHRINIGISATADYTVVIAGVTYSVQVICTGLYKNYLIHFLNKWGGWETMLFNRVSKKRVQNEKKSWQQTSYRVDGSGVVSIKTGSVMHPQKSTFGVSFSEKLKVSTDFLTDAEYQWLSQLVLSPFVYLEDAGILYPVTIEATDYEFKEHIVDMLTNLSLDIDFGTKYNTQFQ